MGTPPETRNRSTGKTTEAKMTNTMQVAHSWFNRFRKLLVRYEKSNSSYEALLHLAATVIIYRKLDVI